MKKSLLLISSLLMCITSYGIQLTLSGDQTGGTGVLTFSQDVTFEITTAINDDFVDFVVQNVSINGTNGNTITFSGLEMSVNGGTKEPLTAWTDRANVEENDISENDGKLLNDDSLTLSIGDVVTIHAGSGTMTQTLTAFNPWTSGNYTMFMVDSSNTIISNDAIPEPYSIALICLFSGGLIVIRRILIL